MRYGNWGFCAVVFGAFVLSRSVSVAAQETAEEVRMTASSQEYLTSFNAAVGELQQRGFGRGLRSPPLDSVANDLLGRNEALIKASDFKVPYSDGNAAAAAVVYDVIVQPGHYNRRTGVVGTSGARVSERALVGYIAGHVADALRKKGLKVLLLQADPVAQHFHAKAFLAIHADGSVSPCQGKASLAYPSSATPTAFAMHAIGWSLAQALGARYDKFERDNYTTNEASYYMFSKVDASMMKGLLEVGELTCREQEDQLVISADAIGSNVARAIFFVIGADGS